MKAGMVLCIEPLIDRPVRIRHQNKDMVLSPSEANFCRTMQHRQLISSTSSVRE